MTKLVAKARSLAWFTLAYNLVEAAVSAFFGIKDSSVALLGFGGDSLIEAASAGVILWRFGASPSGKAKENRVEAEARKFISVLLIALALYLSIQAWFEWRGGKSPASGLPGTLISLVSLAVMAWLYRQKIACARALKSKALQADAFCTLSCMWLSGLLLAGSLLFAGTGLAFFDALAALGMAVLILREGVEEYDESFDDLQKLKKGR